MSQNTVNTTTTDSASIANISKSLIVTQGTIDVSDIRKDHIVGDFSGVVVLLVAAFAIHCILVYGMVKMFTLNKPLAESRADKQEITDGVA